MSGGTSVRKAYVKQQIKRTFPQNYEQMTKIFSCESGLDSRAVGDLTLTYKDGLTTYGASYGLAQIRSLPGRPTPSWLMDVNNNLSYAKVLYDAHGVQPWTCAKIVGASDPGHVTHSK